MSDLFDSPGALKNKDRSASLPNEVVQELVSTSPNDDCLMYLDLKQTVSNETDLRKVRSLPAASSDVLPSTENTYSQLGDVTPHQYDSCVRSRIVYDNSNAKGKKKSFNNIRNKDKNKYVTLKKFWLLCVIVIILWVIVILTLVPMSFGFVKPKYDLRVLIGQISSTPAKSCADILKLIPYSPSGFYWIRLSNGSAVEIFCDMALKCDNAISGGWMKLRTNSDTRYNLACGVCADLPCKHIDFNSFRINHTRVCGNLQEQTNSSDNLLFRQYYLFSGSTIVWSSLNIDDKLIINCTDSSGDIINYPRCQRHSLSGNLKYVSDDDLTLLVCGDSVVAVTEIDIYIQ